MSRVLFSGYYGFQNLGDEALLQGLVEHLRNHHDITILSNDPAYSQKLHQCSAKHRYWHILPEILRNDIVVSGGGSLLQDKTSRRSLQYYLGVIRLAKHFGKRVIVYGQSIGPLSSWGQKQFIQVMQDVPIAVRDRASQQLLSLWGIEATLCADPALLLSTPPKEPADNTIIFIPRAGYPELTHSFIHFAQQYTQQGHTDTPFVIMPLHPQHDTQEVTTFVESIHAKVLEVTTPSDALLHMRQARHIFSGRLHGAILAAVAERPFTGFAYDPKVQAFCDEAEATCLPLAADPDALQQELEHPHKYNGISSLKKRALDGIDWLEMQCATP